jgi:hypothetical protein
VRPPTKIRSELATTVRFDPDNATAIARLRAEHRASRASDYLRSVIDAFPPLTADQIDHLQSILASAHEEILDASSGLEDAGHDGADSDVA